jgi:hypothetical protein
VIIFGTRVKYKVLGEGQFFCPKCQAQRAYTHKKASRYFALYFVPLIPMGQLGEFVQCQTCGMTFKPDVLQPGFQRQVKQTPVDLAKLLNTLPARLAAGTPVEYLVRDLTAGGLDRDVARDMVEPALGAARKSCDACGLTYAASVERCAVCGQPL